MPLRSGRLIFLGTSFTVWLIVMGIIFHIHYIEKRDPDIEYFAPDVHFDNTNRTYYGITQNGTKIGYKSTALVTNPRTLVAWENSAIKLKLAGMSREVFIQCAASVDSTRIFSRHMDFTLQSGTHFYNCKGFVSSDTLIVDVRNESFSRWRKGVFIVPENITYPVALPYYLHRSEADTMTVTVFDPLVFDLYSVTAERKGGESLTIAGKPVQATRYDISFSGHDAALWLDADGVPVRSQGEILFSGIFGTMTSERSNQRNVLLLPIEVNLGPDILAQTRYVPDKSIDDPRSVRYMEIQLNGIRAANIDVEASNKKFISAEPVVFGIHYMPLFTRNITFSGDAGAVPDTSATGTSDYIQSKDARIIRLARQLTEAETDTLEMARKINQWVYSSISFEKGLSIVRSTDILRDRRGGNDEHTKLFTALSRSVGIPTEIHMGLVYEDGAFRYHSWPSVFADGAWNDLDPSFGQNRADATHLTLVRGDFDRLIELYRILGLMSIKILDYR